MNIKEQSFNDFAKIFMNEAFESPEKLLNYSEDKITTYSGVEGTIQQHHKKSIRN